MLLLWTLMHLSRRCESLGWLLKCSLYNLSNFGISSLSLFAGWHLTLSESYSSIVNARLVKLWTTLAIDFEPTDLRLVQVYFRWKDNCIWEAFKEHMWEAWAEACTIHVVSPTFGNVDLFTARAEYLKPGSPRNITYSNWQYLLFVAECAWTVTVASPQKLFKDFRLASLIINISCVYQSIEVPCFLIKLKESFISEVFLVGSDGR